MERTIILVNEIFDASQHVFRGYGLGKNYNRVEFRAESETGKTLKKWVLPNDEDNSWKEMRNEYFDFVDEVKTRFCNCSFETGLNEMNF